MGGRLLRYYLLFCAFMLAAAFFAGVVVQRGLIADALGADLLVARTYVAQLKSVKDLSAADVLGDHLVFTVTDDGVIRALQPLPPSLNDPGLPRWLDQLLRATTYSPGNEMTRVAVAPDGTRWLLASTVGDTAHTIVVMRPGPLSSALLQRLPYLLLLLVGVALAGGLALWYRVDRTLIDPLVRLVDFSEAIRWRGHLRADEGAKLADLSARSSEVGRLAASLMALGEETQRRLVEMTTLLEASRTVVSSLDSEQVLDGILQQVQALFRVERSAVLALDERSGLFRVLASRGLPDAYVAQLRIDPTEPNSASMRALRNQEPIQVADTETDLAYRAFRDRARAEGHRSVLTIPLRTFHARPAVLVLYKSVPYRYSYRELELAASFGHHVSVALENAALFARSDEQLHEQTRRLEAIVESLRDGLVLEGLDGEVLYCNQRAATLLDMRLRTMRMLGGTGIVAELLKLAVDPEAATAWVTDAYQAEVDSTYDLARRLPSGRTQHLRIHIFNVKDANAQQLGRGQLWQDITEDKELDRMKSTLLSTVSHELRTPLATIKGYASTLLAGDVEWDAGAQREFIEIISHESDRLAELVKDLLDMSRIEAGMLDMRCEPHSFNDLVPQVVRRFSPTAQLRIHYDLDPTLPPVPMDASRMETVIRNLLENAIKYSRSDDPIEVTTRRRHRDVLLSVRDRGAGIAADDRQRVFDRFYRADAGLDRATGGVGLGLAICRGLVEAHNGSIWVDHVPTGTLICVSLPLDQANADQAAGEPAMARQTEEALHVA